MMNFKSVMGASLFVLLVGCSSVPDDETQGSSTNKDKSMLDSYNENMHSFNVGASEYVLSPIGTALDYVIPDFVEDAVFSMLDNLSVPNTAINNALQGKFKAAGQDLGRFGINSTIGLLGIIDWATIMGIPNNEEDFGQTLAHYGVDSGPYVVMPLLGGSTPRDILGSIVAFDPINMTSDETKKVVENIGYADMFLSAKDRESMSFEAQKKMYLAMTECSVKDGADSAKESCDLVCNEMTTMMKADLAEIQDETEREEMKSMASSFLPSYCRIEFD